MSELLKIEDPNFPVYYAEIRYRYTLHKPNRAVQIDIVIIPCLYIYFFFFLFEFMHGIEKKVIQPRLANFSVNFFREIAHL